LFNFWETSMAMQTIQREHAGNVVEDVLQMQSTRVFVAGDVILDQYLSGKVSRISPEAPVPVLLETAQRSVLGGAANVAANIASFGGKVTLAGRIGDDQDGEHLIRLCEAKGIDAGAIIKNNHQPTTRKLRVLAGYQQIVRIDAETNERIDQGAEDAIVSSFDQFIANGGQRALVISDYGKGVCTPRLLEHLIVRANAAKVPIITDPKSADLSRYRNTTFIKPNLTEGREILRRKEPSSWHQDLESEIHAIVRVVAEECNAQHVVLSLSEKGVVASTQGNDQLIRYRSEVLQVADVSGAGDTMIAFLAMAAAAGLPVTRGVQLANVAAGTVCGKLGTATLSRAELMDAFQDRGGATRPEKIISLNEARQIASNYREAGKTIVFTNGCFDLLHAGHVSLLQGSRALGDVLFLGLNSDASIKRLKGPERPIQNEQDRATVMAGLGCINYIVLFEEDTPLQLIDAIRPDVIVKGGDYRPEQVVGADIVEKHGGRVVIVPLLEGRSTTRMIEKSKSGQK
jgi:D-beta-D-heptose 7-phosphate kinase/D-beta-D-heptose 1-phosphate adenosyltransferase